MGNRRREYDLTMFDTRNLDRQEVLSLLPRTIYKYFSINEYTIRVIEEGRLWFSSPKSFNDPFDCKVSINFGSNKKEIIDSLDKFLPSEMIPVFKNPDMERFFDNPVLANNLLNKMSATAFDDFLGVCCFSEMADIPLMWAHYANSHKGICLEFANDQPCFIRDNIIPVNYYSEYPEFVIQDENSNNLYMFLMQLIASKSYDWDYEYEWRAITEQGGNTLYEFDKSNLIGVVFGINTEESTSNKIRSIIEKSGYPNVVFKKAFLSEKKYQLDIREI